MPNDMKWSLIERKGETDESTILVGDFITPLSEIDRFSRQKIIKDIVDLNNAISQLDIIDICRLLQPTVAEYTFFSNLLRTFIQIDHSLGHKTHFNKFKRIEIIQSLLSDYNRVTLEINNKQDSWKIPK